MSLFLQGLAGNLAGIALGLAISLVLIGLNSQFYIDMKARPDYSNELETVIVGTMLLIGALGAVLGFMLGDKRRAKLGGRSPGEEVGPLPDWAAFFVVMVFHLFGSIVFSIVVSEVVWEVISL